MDTRTFKVSFRRKSGSRGAIKVTTTVRLPDRTSPLQIHLGYLRTRTAPPDSSEWDRLERKLQLDWSIMYPGATALIDRADAITKWQTIGTKRPHIDREAAREQFARWLHGNPTPIAIFADAPTGVHLEDVNFATFYRISHLDIMEQLEGAGANSADVSAWWQLQEMPRLLHRFYAFALRRVHEAPPFSPGGFVAFARSNIKHQFAAREFMRFAGLASNHPTAPNQTGPFIPPRLGGVWGTP